MTIAFATSRAGALRIDMFDVAGRRVRSLLGGEVSPGSHALQWDGRSDGGGALPAGLYLMRLTTAAGTVTRKVVVVQ